MNRRISVRAIIFLNKKLLCVRLKQYKQGTHQYWCLPGGGLEDGESIIACLNREMIEELGIKPKIGKLAYIQQFKALSQDNLEFFFNVENASDYLNIDLAKTTHGDIEIAEAKFIDPKKNQILPTLLMDDNLAKQLILDTPVSIFSYL